ncbi:MAG: SDR family oxidoreductase [Hyphomicrobiales bacterium]
MPALHGRNILVTGGSRGIGAAIVEAIAGEGARPIIHYGRDKQSAEKLLDRIGGVGWITQADFLDPAQPSALFEQAVHLAGRIHGVVNNAGIRSEIDVTADLSSWHLTWARDMQMNLYAPADLCRAALLHFRQHGGGHIVTIASRAGQRGYSADAMPYGASKAAVLNLSKSIARSFGHEGVVSVAIAPGWVKTDMVKELMAGDGLTTATADIPIGRIAEPGEIAELVALALRPSVASLNGATLDVNGGSYIR